MDEERDTAQLRADQLAREHAEKQQAEAAFDETEQAQHDRRADKARYLRERLDERAASEQAVAEQEAADRDARRGG